MLPIDNIHAIIDDQPKQVTTNKTTPHTTTNLTSDYNSRSINDRIIAIPPKKFITNIKYFKNICELEEDKVVAELKPLLSQCSKGRIKKWFKMEFQLKNGTTYNPISYSVHNEKVKISQLLLESFNKSSYRKTEYLFYLSKKPFSGYIARDIITRATMKLKYYRYHIAIAKYIEQNIIILEKSLEYNNYKLTSLLIDFYIQDNSMSFSAYNTLIENSINNGQIHILQKVLAEFHFFFKTYDKNHNLWYVLDQLRFDLLRFGTLSLAISKNDYNMVELLLDNYRRLDVLKYYSNLVEGFVENNIICKALKTNNLDIIKLLVKYATDLNKSFHESVCYSKVSPFCKNLLGTILIASDYSAVYIKHTTSNLEQAVKFCDSVTILWLIENGMLSFPRETKEDDRKTFQFTPLHLAIFLNKPEVVAILLATKVSSSEDKAWYPVVLNERVFDLYSITAQEYASQLNDGKDRSEIISMLKGIPLPALILAELAFIKHHIKNDSLEQLKLLNEYFNLPTIIIKKEKQLKT